VSPGGVCQYEGITEEEETPGQGRAGQGNWDGLQMTSGREMAIQASVSVEGSWRHEAEVGLERGAMARLGAGVRMAASEGGAEALGRVPVEERVETMAATGLRGCEEARRGEVQEAEEQCMSEMGRGANARKSQSGDEVASRGKGGPTPWGV
jgi:hypothetical protein